MSSLRKALGYLGRGEFRTFFSALAKRIPSWLYRRRAAQIYVLRAADMEAAAGPARPLPEGYTFGEVQTPEDVARGERIGLRPAEYQRRIDHGERHIAVLFEGRPVSSLWMHFGPCYILGLDLLIEADASDAYSYGAFTDPNHRRKGLYGSMKREQIRLCREAGAVRLFGIIETGNLAPQRTHEKLGYQVVGSVETASILSLTRTVVEWDGVRRVNYRLWRRAPRGVFRV